MTSGGVGRLRRIEGQVRGIQRMLDESRYCVEVMTQIEAATAALSRVQDEILDAHLGHCVTEAMEGGDAAVRREKLDEVVGLLKKYRRSR